MDKYHERKHTMYNSVIKLFGSNADKFADYDALKDSLAKFTAVVVLIAAAFVKVTKEDDESSGATGDKAAAREALVDDLLPVKCNLHSYALKANDHILVSKSEMAAWKVRRLRDRELVDMATNVYAAALPIVSKLSGYKITDAVLAKIKSETDVFEGLLGTQSSGEATHAGSRASMPDLFNQADDLLENHITNNMESLRQTEPEFYNQYVAAKQIKEVGVRHNQKPAAAPQAQSK